MEILVMPALYAILVWWAGTGAILWLDRRPRRTFRGSMVGATFALGFALAGLALTADDTSVFGAYAAFTFAVLVWAWQELAFLTGYLTGSRRTSCPEGASGWRRARYAIETILHHEIAVLVLAAMVAALCAGGANPVGAWTFLVLWVMRLSAKLNLFLGVRNRGEDLLPPHLAYLGSYFARRPVNLLLPFAVVAAVLVAVELWQRALAPGAGSGAAAGLALVASLLSLAILEHALMVVPLPAARLWRWSLSSRGP